MHEPLQVRICQLCHQGVESEEFMFFIVLFHMKYEGDTIASSNKALVPTKQGIGIQRSTVLRTVFARSEET